MYLTKEEEKILEGYEGIVRQRALEIVVKVGEVLGAKRLIEVAKAHISGISYKNIGDAGLELIEELFTNRGAFSIPVSLNPAGMDLKLWKLMNLSKTYVEKQLRIISCLKSMGARPLLTCVPYLIEPPSFGEQIAWGESNAILYANSVLGARTNREGGPLALFEAIVGRAPYVDLRVNEFRKPTVYVICKLRKNLKFSRLPGLIGFHIGSVIKSGIPYIRGVTKFLRDDYDLRLFLAGMGTAGGIGLALINGISPEAPKGVPKDLEKVEVDEVELRESYERLSIDLESVDAITLGCPHLSNKEFRNIVDTIKLKGKSHKRIIVFLPRSISNSFSLVKLRKYNLEVYNDTCMVVCDLKAMGIERVVVDSAKAAYYLSSQGYDVQLMSFDDILRWAFT